jgi:hypothetical protein
MLSRRYLLLTIALLSAGCQAQAVVDSPALGPQTWIDAPLGGAVLPLAPYPVIAHASHPDGVASLELLVNGASLASVPPGPGDEDGTLAQASWMWDIPGPGRYELEVRAVGSNGGSGPSAFGHVTVPGDTPTPSPTPTPDATSTPTSTATPAAGFGAPAFSSGVFYYGSAGCTPREITVDVLWMDSQMSQPNVVMFYRLAEVDGGERTEWNAEAMNPLGGGVYRRSLTGSGIPDYDAFPASALQVQFVATNDSGDEVGRSDVFSGPGLVRCGFTPPPIFLITPTATLETPA